MADEKLKIYEPNEIEDTPIESVLEETGSEDSTSDVSGVSSPETLTRTLIPNYILASDLINASLDTQKKRILSNYGFSESGSIQVGKYVAGVSGDIRISPDGLIGRNKSNVTTFAIDGTTGDATFMGTIMAGAVVVGYTKSFVSTLIWTSVDQDTATWSAGAITDAAGTVYTITGGTTGNIIATTYVYLDTAVSITLLQTTTTPTTAIGTGKTLLAIVTKGATPVINCAIDVIWSKGTVIDGGKITTGSISLSQLNFVPLSSSGLTTAIVATINASAEGIVISGGKVEISGSTTFSAGYDPTTKVASAGGNYASAPTGARVLIFPSANIGMQVIDDIGGNVLEIMVGGTTVGDIIVGDYSGGHGMLWDKSASRLYIKGNLTAGDMSGVDITIGSGDAVFRAASAGIWLGDADFSDAPFRVNMDGDVVAKSIYLWGTVVTDSGGMLRTSSGNDRIEFTNTDYLRFYNGGSLKGTLRSVTNAGASGIVCVGGDLVVDNTKAFLAKGIDSNDYMLLGCNSSGYTTMTLTNQNRFIIYETNGSTEVFTASSAKCYSANDMWVNGSLRFGLGTTSVGGSIHKAKTIEFETQSSNASEDWALFMYSSGGSYSLRTRMSGDTWRVDQTAV